MKSSKLLSVLLAFAIHLFLVPTSDSQTSPIAINPERNQLLEDALSWLTLRRDGKLLTTDQSVPFLEALRHYYRSSRYFRAIVISFQYGILPKLTLGQGETCESAYGFGQRNSFNDSITWYWVKVVTQTLYNNRKQPSHLNRVYCDYRQGLLCHSTTKKCECPEGSKMGPIEDNSPIQRCQVEEDQPCALADLAISATNEKLIGKLHEIIFNLEKPLSCEWGTQCRHKGSRYTKCISTSKAPFDSTISNLNYGEECVVGYIGEKGSCQITSLYKGATCYNFWGYLKDKKLPASGVNRQKGFCALDMAPYVTPGITYIENLSGLSSIKHTDYFIPVLVNPRTVNMSSSDLLAYDKELHQITKLYIENRIQKDEGKPCSVADTNKLKEIWNFYMGLQGDSPEGHDFVADVPTLNAKLAEYKNLIGNSNEPKICRIVYIIEGGYTAIPLVCKRTGNFPDAGINNGKCVELNDKDELQRLYEHALAQFNFYQINIDARDDYRFWEGQNHFHPGILEKHPEKQCTQTQTKVKGKPFQIRAKYLPVRNRGDVLEDGTCQDDRYFCFEDLSDAIEIYVNSPSDCSFIPDYEPKYACFDVASYETRLDECEKKYIRERARVALETVSKLEWGASCDYQTERDILEYLPQESERAERKINGYRALWYLQYRGICDPAKLLECSTGYICECIENTEVRKSADGMYSSDYCYLTSGPCNADVTQLVSLRPEEAEAARLHYGDPQSVGADCSNGNICNVIDAESDTCTVTTTGPDSEKGNTLEPFDGAEMVLKQQNYLVLIISMIIISFSSAYR